jgi:Flp pilus assembly protein TadG
METASIMTMIDVQTIKSDNKGAAAIEFAILAPVFILLLLTFVAYGIYLGAAHSVQQLAADASRAAIAGLDANERQSLATAYIRSSSLDGTFLDLDKLSVKVETDPLDANQFTVALSYDASGLPIWSLYSFVMPGQVIHRYSTIRVGGI